MIEKPEQPSSMCENFGFFSMCSPCSKRERPEEQEFFEDHGLLSQDNETPLKRYDSLDAYPEQGTSQIIITNEPETDNECCPCTCPECCGEMTPGKILAISAITFAMMALGVGVGWTTGGFINCCCSSCQYDELLFDLGVRPYDPCQNVWFDGSDLHLSADDPRFAACTMPAYNYVFAGLCGATTTTAGYCCGHATVNECAPAP